MTGGPIARAPVKALLWLMGFPGLLILAAGAAQACSCDPLTPTQGFDRAQYVFTGRVVEEAGHTWTVDVDRVWKGSETLPGRVRLLDVYKGIDCEFYFEPGRSYLFFAIVAKSSRYRYYQPEACNWTSALHSKRIGSMWLEDLIVREHGLGEAPKGEDPWQHLPGGSDLEN